MKIQKRILSALLAITLFCTMSPLSPAIASGPPDHEMEAHTLNAMGLFNGYDSTGTNFGLNDQATREQSLIFLIRMLGEEKAALAWTGAAPFTDIPSASWALPYVGYAKEKGYTVGLLDGQFGLGRTATMAEMTTFALRGLGYSDAAGVGDFTYKNCLTFAKEKGILTSDTAISPFTRGNAVGIIYSSIQTKMKGQDYTLISNLVNTGVVTQAQYDAAMGTSTTPEGKPSADAGSASLIQRHGKSLTRYNSLIAECNKMGIKDAEFTKSVNELSTEIDKMTAVINTGSLTAAQVTEYAKSLDALDEFMAEMDKLVKASGAGTTESAKLITRFEASVTRYNTLVDQLTKLGLTESAELVKEMNSITDEINKMGVVMMEGATLTATQITEYTTALNDLDQFLKEMDQLIKDAPAV